LCVYRREEGEEKEDWNNRTNSQSVEWMMIRATDAFYLPVHERRELVQGMEVPNSKIKLEKKERKLHPHCVGKTITIKSKQPTKAFGTKEGKKKKL